jgi:hypothetical protein
MNDDNPSTTSKRMYDTNQIDSVKSQKMKGSIHMVIASKNNSWTSDIFHQLEEMQCDEENIMQLNLVHLNAGHWVHVDALDELVETMAKEIMNPPFKDERNSIFPV